MGRPRVWCIFLTIFSFYYHRLEGNNFQEKTQVYSPEVHRGRGLFSHTPTHMATEKRKESPSKHTKPALRSVFHHPNPFVRFGLLNTLKM